MLSKIRGTGMLSIVVFDECRRARTDKQHYVPYSREKVV